MTPRNIIFVLAVFFGSTLLLPAANASDIRCTVVDVVQRESYDVLVQQHSPGGALWMTLSKFGEPVRRAQGVRLVDHFGYRYTTLGPAKMTLSINTDSAPGKYRFASEDPELHGDCSLDKRTPFEICLDECNRRFPGPNKCYEKCS